MPQHKQYILEYARRVPRDWIDRWPWIANAVIALFLLLVLGACAAFAWLLLEGPPP